MKPDFLFFKDSMLVFGVISVISIIGASCKTLGFQVSANKNKTHSHMQGIESLRLLLILSRMSRNFSFSKI